MRVLVTGASGFVGRHLSRALVAGGHGVVAALRGDLAELPDGVTPVAVGDIGPETAWRAALDGVDAVAHLAGRAHVMRDAADAEARYVRTNVEGTRRLAEEAVGTGVRRFVFLSSVKAVGERTADAPFTPDAEARPEDAYGRTKLDAEAALRLAAEGTGTEAVIIRPPLVYGPGVKGNLLTLLSAVAGGRPLPLGAVDNRRSFVYVENLCDAVARAVAAPAAAGTYFVRDGDDVSTAELIRRMAAALGRPPRLFPVPVGVLRLVSRITGKSASVQRVSDSLQVDDTSFRADFDWRPPFTMNEGLERTAAWYKSRSE